MTSLQRFAATPDGHLSAGMRAAYARDGFLLIEDFVSPEAIVTLKQRIGDLVCQFDADTVRTVFATDSQDHAADLYFRHSGEKIRFFFEKGAFDSAGNLMAEKHRALNKIGHALHDLDPVFDRFCRDRRLAAIAGDLGLADPGLVQSMVIFKQPRIGGEVGMHQDATFLATEPQSVTGFWFALEDADIGNGCLVALPGGHRGPLKERFHYAGETLTMLALHNVDWPQDDLLALEVRAGTLIVLHGLLPHGSAPNLSDRSRQAFTLHVIDRSAAWSPENWLRRGDGMPVAGFSQGAR